MTEELTKLSKSDVYPFHMPGHKRQLTGISGTLGDSDWLSDIASYDITEIDGFDDLQAPSGLIADIEYRLAALYGADRAFLLVNGSTCGNLAAVSALVPKGGRLMADRGAHRSVYNAAFLGGDELVFLERKEIPGTGLTSNISLEEIEGRLLGSKTEDKLPDAVLITSPTYEGFLADIDRIAEITHRYGIPLIADSAHGAHITKEADPPFPARSQNADITVVSLHKTLPALTQVSALLINGPMAEPEVIKRYINIFQTTSPSYILMASADRCLRIIEKNGAELRKRLKDNLDRIYSLNDRLKHLYLTGPEHAGKNGIYAFDKSKLNIIDRTGRMSGQALYDTLRKEYHIQPEKAASRTCLMIASIMDTKNGFDRLIRAVEEIDSRI